MQYRCSLSASLIFKPAGVRQSQLFDLVIHHPFTDAQHLGCILLHPVTGLQSLDDQGFLDIIQFQTL